MKKSRFTESQIVFALKQSETGVKVEEVCRKMGISEATFYNWKKKFGGLGITELRRLRQLEEENSQLKKLVADLSLDKQILQEVLKKKCESRFRGVNWRKGYSRITGFLSEEAVVWCFYSLVFIITIHIGEMIRL